MPGIFQKEGEYYKYEPSFIFSPQFLFGRVWRIRRRALFPVLSRSIYLFLKYYP